MAKNTRAAPPTRASTSAGLLISRRAILPAIARVAKQSCTSASTANTSRRLAIANYKEPKKGRLLARRPPNSVRMRMHFPRSVPGVPVRIVQQANRMRRWLITLACLMLGTPAVAQRHQPIIDVHKHASWPGADDAAARAALLTEMDAEHIVLSVLYINEPGDVQGWLAAAPGRFIGGPAMPCPPTPQEPFYRCFPETKGWPTLEWVNRGLAVGGIGILGEMLFVYTGDHPDDARMRPYWALAAMYDVPVAVHINRGP